MLQPPRRPKDRILDRYTVSISLAQGFVALGIVLAIYIYGMMQGLGGDELRSLSFITIVVASHSLICTNRSWPESIITTFGKQKTGFWWVIGATIIVPGAVPVIPAFRDLFRFAPVSPGDLLLCVIGG